MGIIIVINGLSLEEVIVANGNANGACFVVLVVVWAIAGMLFGQIRTLKNLGWLANIAIWLNVITIFMTMGIVAHSPPLFEAAIAANADFNIQPGDPIRTTPGLIPGLDFTVALVGLGQAIYAYGGAMLFVEFMAEMRRPFDFWKGMLFAQTFIYFFYMLFALFVYSYQGQYTLNPAYQGIGQAAVLTAGNVIQLLTSLIATVLYGNIGIKGLYNNVLMDLLGFPALSVRSGKLLWVAVVPVYWALAFIIATAIPQVSNLSAFIASACIMQFSYSFPPFLMLGYHIKRDAYLDGDGFDPATGAVVRQDSGVRRYVRGFMKKPILNTWHIIFFLGSLTVAALGMYSSIVQLRAQYGLNPGTSFSCNNPYA